MLLAGVEVAVAYIVVAGHSVYLASFVDALVLLLANMRQDPAVH